jgi:hypothetical protein
MFWHEDEEKSIGKRAKRKVLAKDAQDVAHS